MNTEKLWQQAQTLSPGLVVVVLITVAAKFLSEHYSAPPMLMALLLGIAVNFLSEEGKTKPGVNFAARSLLRLGIAFLGARISFDLILALGAGVVALIVAGLVATILFGLGIGRFFGFKLRFSFLTAGSVAICGASAAMAISAILPKDERSEERLIFTVVGVTVLSTIAMIAYPILVQALEMSHEQAGVFLGGTIHDVAQVVGAGFTVSEQTGESATIVKLMRVALLAPVVIIASLIIRRSSGAAASGKAPPLLPLFVLAFLCLATLNSLNVIPEIIGQGLSESSRWLLLIAITAVGTKTNLRQVLSVGPAAIGLIVAETLFIAGFILTGVYLLM
jgi:uncharacterized integral membrane protein (TIGR00698 family)